MSYHNRRTNTTTTTTTNTTAPVVPASVPTTRAINTTALPATSAVAVGANTLASAPASMNVLGKKVGFDKNGTLCLCADGATYSNCGNNCECCGEALKLKYKYLDVEKHSTISCPCSSYAVVNMDGDVECEMDFLNLKRRLKPVVLKNHTIDGGKPKVRDKWNCDNNPLVPCSQGTISWDSLHVVRVESSKSDKRIALRNSRSSTSNCYIPPTSLVDFIAGTDANGYSSNMIASNLEIYSKETLGIDIRDEVDYINNIPLFKDKETAELHDFLLGTNLKGLSRSSEYLNDDGVTMYFPGVYYPNKNIITGVFIAKREVLSENIMLDWDYKSLSSEDGRLKVGPNNSIINIKILGKNKPMFSITIKDSAKRNILKSKIKNVVVDGEFNLSVRIPNLSSGKIKETYHVEITPSADTAYFIPTDRDYSNSYFHKSGVVKYTIWQHINPKISLHATASTLANTSTAIDTAASISGTANDRVNSQALTHSFTLTRTDAAVLSNFYVNNSSRLRDLLTSESSIKKTLIDQVDKKVLECSTCFKINDTNLNQKVEPGMSFRGKVTKVKTVFKSIELDAYSKEIDDERKIVEVITNKFELENTNNLIEGMSVVGVDQDGFDFKTTLTSIDCQKSITLAAHYTISTGTKLTFDWVDGGNVTKVESNKITSEDCFILPNNTELTFHNQTPALVNGRIQIDQIGSRSMKVTSTITSMQFDQHDYAYILNPDLFITNKPSAYNQYIQVFEDQSVVIHYVKPDEDSNKNKKTVTITKSPSAGTLSTISDREGDTLTTYATYAPSVGFTGHDTVKFTVSDGVNTSDEKTIFITIK